MSAESSSEHVPAHPRAASDRWFGLTPEEAEAWARGDPALRSHEEHIWRRIWVYVKFTLPNRTGRPRPSDADADDITQQTRIKICETYRQDLGPLRSWAYRIAAQQSVNRHRAEQRQDKAEQNLQQELGPPSLLRASDDEPWLATSEDEAELDRLRQAIVHAAGRLTPRLRQAYEICIASGDYRALVGELGVPLGTAAARWSRARAAIANELEVEGYRLLPRGTALPEGTRVVLLLDSSIVIRESGEAA